MIGLGLGSADPCSATVAVDSTTYLHVSPRWLHVTWCLAVDLEHVVLHGLIIHAHFGCIVLLLQKYHTAHGGDVGFRKDQYADMVNKYYDLATSFYEYGEQSYAALHPPGPVHRQRCSSFVLCVCAAAESAIPCCSIVLPISFTVACCFVTDCRLGHILPLCSPAEARDPRGEHQAP